MLAGTASISATASANFISADDISASTAISFNVDSSVIADLYRGLQPILVAPIIAIKKT